MSQSLVEERRMMRFLIGVGVMLLSVAFFGAAFADSIVEDTAEALYRRAAAQATNFADPDGYKRQAPVQGAGDSGASGDSGDAGAGASGGNGDGCSR